jgi:spore coat polysaccharide biosynthesis predicted glycosyltransferase SpsG
MGFGHLVRSRTLSTALGVPHVVSFRGSRSSAAAARRLGSAVIEGSLRLAIRSIRPQLLVIDDPSRPAASRAVRIAREHGIPTVSLHDLGHAPCASNLSIDGTIAPGPMSLSGVRYAVLDPKLLRVRAATRTARPGRPVVLIAFGGGSRRHLAAAIVRAIRRRIADVQIRIAGGFCGTVEPRQAGVVCVAPNDGLWTELARATVAVTAGGVSLYEACAVGVPAVGVSVVRAQRRTVAGLARCGAVLDGGHGVPERRAAERVARMVNDLLRSHTRRRALSTTARQLVDGRGAFRVASAICSLLPESSERRAA